jgi:hypothetical protein
MAPNYSIPSAVKRDPISSKGTRSSSGAIGDPPEERTGPIHQAPPLWRRLMGPILSAKKI